MKNTIDPAAKPKPTCHVAALEASSTITGGLVEAFAAGALLTMIADEMAPEAYDRASIYAGLATVAGFALAVWLTTLD